MTFVARAARTLVVCAAVGWAALFAYELVKGAV